MSPPTCQGYNFESRKIGINDPALVNPFNIWRYGRVMWTLATSSAFDTRSTIFQEPWMWEFMDDVTLEMSEYRMFGHFK